MMRIIIKLSNHCILTVALLFTSNVFAGEYLFDVLKRPNYADTWYFLISNEKNVDPWLANYPKSGGGPSSPGKPVKLSDGVYHLHNVCKAHDCGDNMFYVLFSPNADKAWGLLKKGIYFKKNEANEYIKGIYYGSYDYSEKTLRFFGEPDNEKRQILLIELIN